MSTDAPASDPGTEYLLRLNADKVLKLQFDSW